MAELRRRDPLGKAAPPLFIAHALPVLWETETEFDNLPGPASLGRIKAGPDIVSLAGLRCWGTTLGRINKRRAWTCQT
jgi:hypothetical protein